MTLASMGRLTTAGRRAIGLAFLAAFLWLLVGDAQAAWLPTEPIVASGPTASDPQVAADAQGDVFVAWVTANPTNHAIVVSEHPAGGSWTPPVQRIPATQDCQDPKLAVNAAGVAVLVADCKSGSTPMRYVTRNSFGTWSTISGEIAGSGNGKEPRVGIDSAGDFAVAWQTEGSPTAVDAVYAPAGGGFGAVKQVSTPTKVATNPNLAMTATGAVDLAWLEKREEIGHPGDPVVQVMLARKHGASEWEPPGHLTSNFTNAPVAFGEPQVEVNGTYQIVAWSQEPSHPEMIARNSNGDTGGFSAFIIGVSESGSVENPGVGIDRSGRSVATWLRFPSGPESLSIKWSSLASPGASSWALPAYVEEGGGTGASHPELAVSPSGFTVSAWYNGGGTSRAATRPAGGAFGAPVTVTTLAQPTFEGPVVTTAGEDPVVVWNVGNHPAVAVEDRTAPALAPTATSVAIGAATSFSANATDAWGPVTVAWDFGDGSTASGASVSHSYASAGTKTATVTATDAAGNSASAAVTAVVTDPSASGGGGSGGSGGAGGSGAGSSDRGARGGPGGSHSPQSPHQIKVTAAPIPQSWAKQAKAKAIQVKCKLDVKGTCIAVATVSKGVAKKLGLALPRGKKPVRIGSGSTQVATANRFAIVKVKLKAKALAAIAASPRPVAVAIALQGTAPGNDPGVAMTRTTLQP